MNFPGGNHSSNSSLDDGENPFVTFRRFADEQISALLQSVIGLPSAIYSGSDRTRWLHYDEQTRQNMMESWGRSCPAEQRKRAHRLAEEGVEPESFQTRGHKDEASMRLCSKRESCRDTEGTEGNCLAYGCRTCPRGGSSDSGPKPLPENTDSTTNSTSSDAATLLSPMSSSGPSPILLRFLEDNPSLFDAWTAMYAMHSRYSPLRLEAEDSSKNHGLKWRDAFEDLINTQTGREMSPSTSQKQETDQRDWLGQLIHQTTQESNPLHIWDSFLPTVICRLHSQEEEEEERDTERAVPDGKAPGDHIADLVANMAHESTSMLPREPESRALDTPNVTATMTRTEQTTLPDGTVQTKIVLKKRFADGREQSSETVHTTPGSGSVAARCLSEPPMPMEKQRAVASAKDYDKAEEKEKEKKGGWFWS